MIVDETADPRKAASDIIAGGAFDNNLLCLGEKEIFVTERAASNFMRELENCGAERLSPSALDRLTGEVFESKNGGYALKRALVGKDPQVLARAAGANVSAKTKMLFAETGADHPFVVEEQMMPMVPVVVVKISRRPSQQPRKPSTTTATAR